MGVSLELLSAEAECLAAVTLADGKLLDIEHKNACSILTGFQASEGVGLYNKCIDLSYVSENPTGLTMQLNALRRLSFEHKMKFVEGLWQVATCDDDLHKNEELFIYSVIDRIGLTRRDSIPAQRRVCVIGNF